MTINTNTQALPPPSLEQRAPQQVQESLGVPSLTVYGMLDKHYNHCPAPDVVTANERLSLAYRIRERDPGDLTRNAERAITGIEQFYLEERLSERKGLVKGVSNARALRQLHEKATAFGHVFDDKLFSDIVHGTAENLGDTVELKSPMKLAEESGGNLNELVKHSGPRDIAIGNADYVFANPRTLTSFTGVARNSYRVTSGNGYVVPADIHYMYSSQSGRKSEDPAINDLSLYADNIYSIPEFKEVFALYSAALFDTPEEALGFYKTFKHMMAQARRWDISQDSSSYDRWDLYGPLSQNHDGDGREYSDGEGHASDKSHSTALKMRELLERFSIYPPMEPEFQFRGQVRATRVE